MIDKHSQHLLDGETFMIIAPSEDLCMRTKKLDKIPGGGYYRFDGEEPSCVSRAVSIEMMVRENLLLWRLRKMRACKLVRYMYT